MPQAGNETQDVDGRAGSADLFADRSGFVDATDARLEFHARQPPNEIQQHFFGAADLQRVRHVDDASHQQPTRARWNATVRCNPSSSDTTGVQPISSRIRAMSATKSPVSICAASGGHATDSTRPLPAARMIARAISTSGVPTPVPTLYARPWLRADSASAMSAATASST